ncbi:MAG: CrcB family protein [Iamia sp.]
MGPTDAVETREPRSAPPSPTGLEALAVVAAGGAVGSVLRWGVAAAWPTPAGGWGWSTVAVNLSGAFLLGLVLALLAGAAARRGAAPRWHHLARLGLGTGLLGGWTTFSTLAVEVDRSLAAGRPGLAATAVSVSLVGGLVLAAAGTAAGRRLAPAPGMRHR